jgi:hypothetical protein
MDFLSAATHIVDDLLIFVGAMVVLCVILLAIIARLPAGNPLKRILVAFCYRLAAMLGAGIVAIPIEPIPGVDAIYDAAAAAGLLIYWATFFVAVARILSTPRAARDRAPS